jgi:hypothetical protein
MSKVADIISRVRVNLRDSAGADWSDADLLTIIKKTVERMNHILIKNGVLFAKATPYEFDTSDGTATYALPADHMVPADGLFRRDWDAKLDMITDAEWEQMPYATSVTRWRINGANIEIKDTPDKVVEMVYYYWPKVDTSDYATTTDMPWDSLMDTPIEEYVTLRCLNIEEADISADVRLLTDITNNFIGNYATQTPNISEVAGFYPLGGAWDA